MQHGARRTVSGGGFALHEAFQGCVGGVSEPHVVQFPPLGGGEAATHSGVVGEVVYVLGAVVSGTVRVLAREPAVSSVNPLCRASTRYLE